MKIRNTEYKVKRSVGLIPNVQYNPIFPFTKQYSLNVNKLKTPFQRCCRHRRSSYRYNFSKLIYQLTENFVNKYLANRIHRASLQWQICKFQQSPLPTECQYTQRWSISRKLANTRYSCESFLPRKKKLFNESRYRIKQNIITNLLQSFKILVCNASAFHKKQKVANTSWTKGMRSSVEFKK